MEDIEKLMRETLKDAEMKAPEGVWSDIEGRLASKSATLRRLRWVSATVVVAVAVTTAIIMLGGNGKGADTAVVAQTSIADDVITVSEQAKEESLPTVVASKDETKVNKVNSETPSTVEKRDKGIGVKEIEPQVVTPSNNTNAIDAQKKMALKTADDEDKHDHVDVKADNKEKTPVAVVESVKTDKDNGEPEPKTKPQDLIISIPNVITPNGDGYNDCWRIPDLERYSHVAVQIFTAKSQQIYSSSDYRGDFCGADLPEGNYFYVIRIRDINYSRRGVLVIKR
ncbi:MAG: gliding motility-associated C-terminal domain-containing protein [Bacteroidales bacterium]|nr:gliding motility-associated C-terminal domain-containing protein [Bacteroidales bacterium]